MGKRKLPARPPKPNSSGTDALLIAGICALVLAAGGIIGVVKGVALKTLLGIAAAGASVIAFSYFSACLWEAGQHGASVVVGGLAIPVALLILIFLL
jgi:hypothetical protein